MQTGSAYVYTDLQGLSSLKLRAVQGEQGAVSEVARQFESLMLQQMLKAMRQTSFSDGLLDSDQSLFYRDLYDQQLAIHIAENGGLGLAEVIERQLGATPAPAANEGRQLSDYQSHPRPLAPAWPVAGRQEGAGATQGAAPVDPPQPAPPQQWDSSSFVHYLWPWASEAAGLLGLKPQMLLAQAALETGWGRYQMKRANGEPAYNLFGIKADDRWRGDKVVKDTLEFRQGVAVRRREAFRAYDSYAESFRDYAEFLQQSPRYRKALGLGDDPAGYFSELQKAGYATDPRYADKIRSLLEGPQMRQALERLKNEAGQPL